jgi:hypothetical protein
VLEWIESFGIGLWLRESPSVWSHPTVLTLHTTGMAVLVGASWLIDLRVLGMSRTIPLSEFRWTFRVVAIGLFVNVCTGILLFIKNATSLGTAVPFLVKMALVVASAATILPIRRYVLASSAGDTAITDSAQSRARLLAIASLFAWAGAVTAGRLLAYLVP